MKKLLSSLAVLVFAFCLCISISAYESPGGTKYNKVTINHTATGENECTTSAVVVGDTIIVSALESNSRIFYGFKVYVQAENGTLVEAVPGVDYEVEDVTLIDNTPAVENVDYISSKGYIKSKNGKLLTVTFKPINDDLFISESYQGVDIKFNTKDYGVLSPPTGGVDAVLVVLCSIAALSLAGVLVSRKRSHN